MRNRAARLVFLLLLLPLSRATGGPPPEDAQRLNQEGNALFQEKRYAEALVRFEGALLLVPDHGTLRRNVAEACAALGSEESAASDWTRAAAHFSRAASLMPTDPRFPLWLGVAREEEGSLREAEAAYAAASALAPKDPVPLGRLGRLLSRQDRLREAIPYLEKAVVLDPGNAEAARLLKQAMRDADFEKGLDQTGASLFDIAFDGTVNAAAAQQVLSMLLLAQTEVGNALSLSQRDKVRVILYSAKEYADVTSAPEWAAAHFDGKLRLPIKDLERREREIKATIFHEYVHALLNESLPKCPSWLHEGLAQVEEFRILGSAAEAGRLKAVSGLREGDWIPLAELEAPIASLRDTARITLAYAESISFVRYLEGRFGQSAMQVFLTRWKAQPKKLLREAFREAYGYDLEDLEKDWHGS